MLDIHKDVNNDEKEYHEIYKMLDKKEIKKKNEKAYEITEEVKCHNNITSKIDFQRKKYDLFCQIYSKIQRMTKRDK